MLVIFSASAKASAESEALKNLQRALIKQFKIDKMARKLEKKYIHEDVRFYGGHAWVVADVIIKQRVTYKWTF